MSPSDLAASRGEPSYVWRSGQERRLRLMTDQVDLGGARVLEDGCGTGTYAAQIAARFDAFVVGLDIEAERVAVASERLPRALVAAAERLPHPAGAFDVVFSNEVIEHVANDRAALAEMVRVVRPGGRILIFCPNRWYPFETHGHYWRGQYHFGNTPLINYLPDALRNRLAPHVRAYTARGLRHLADGLPVRIVTHTRIFGGYDNIMRRAPRLARFLRLVLYMLEATPFRVLGLSHFLVLEKTDG